MDEREAGTEPGDAKLGFAAFGVEGSLSVEPADLLAPARDLLPPGWTSHPPDTPKGRFTLSRSDGDYEVGVNGNRVVRTPDLDIALGLLDAQIRAHVSLRAPQRVFVHAGVAATEAGAIVIPGRSFSGKTTLVAALVAAGATYYSDEYAVLDDAGLVHPYPRPLSVRDGGATATNHSAESLGGSVGTEALPVGVIAVTSYRPGARWAPERGSPGDGAMALLANTVPARDRPREALAAVSRASASALVLEGERGEAAETAAELLAATRASR